MEAQPPSPQPHILQNSVVVFSKNYLPLTRINIKRAVVLLIKGQAESVNFGTTKQWEVRSPSVVLQVPKHIRLIASNPKRQWKVPPVNRREVLRRDNHICQYCGNTKHLTLDHVIPRSKGGQHTWDNVVTACEKCNSKKSVLLAAALRYRLLHEAGMILKTKPKAPIHPAVVFAEQFWNAQRLAESE
jgi:5-methylcytosine-specific restriction endonuclease McrA